jgi:uncharacterized YigZ family protein
LSDHFDSIAQPSTGLFIDRASKFYAFAWPVSNEEEIKLHQEALRKEHFKARHHCFAWRLGTDLQQFRANDDGEPSGTAGRPILGQIDAHGYTDVLVVVVRYFGGTLLGASGLINAYREAARLALESSERVTHFISDQIVFEVGYGSLAAFTDLLRKTRAQILSENWSDQGCTFQIQIRQSETKTVLDKIKSGMYGLPATEAEGLEWPEDIAHSFGETLK